MADESVKYLILITSGKELLMEIKPSLIGKPIEPICVPNFKYADEKLSSGNCIAIVVDFSWIKPHEREAVLAFHKRHEKIPFFVLETTASMSPSLNSPLRRLPWPLPLSFTDQVRVISRPVIIFTEHILFSTGAVQKAFQDAGVKFITFESIENLTDYIINWNEKRIKAMQSEKIQNEYGNLAIINFSDTQQEAYNFDISIRNYIPQAVSYFLSSLEFEKYALQSIKNFQPVHIPWEYASHIPTILIEETKEDSIKLKKRGVEHILLIDNFKPTLMSLKQALVDAGYRVTATMDAEEALKISHKGEFHLAVIGTAITFAQHTGAELAQKMREIDPDLRIIFMVDQYPLHSALKGISKVVELGLDDAILKPVEPSRLIFSVEKALERRFLMLENVRLLKETQELNHKLETINGFQKKFFATVAHDVKSPLTAILGYAEVLTNKLKNMQDLQRYASNILTSAKTLSLLISDLVDIAAMESGKLRVEMGELNLMSVINDVYERIKIAAQNRKINLYIDLPPSLPILKGDNARIGQVIQNLCTNAIQYTKEGGKVTIKAELMPDRIIVSVIDTGIGISKEDIPRVWERFFQTKEAQNMRKAGFGLGLKIAREIVQLHGGEMGLESKIGVGSRFFFHLPILKTENSQNKQSK